MFNPTWFLKKLFKFMLGCFNNVSLFIEQNCSATRRPLVDRHNIFLRHIIVSSSCFLNFSIVYLSIYLSIAFQTFNRIFMVVNSFISFFFFFVFLLFFI